MPSSLNDAELSEIKLQAIEWLVRLRSDSIRDDEIRELASWLAQDYLHTEAFAYAEDLFDAMLLAAPTASGTARKAPVAPPIDLQRKSAPYQRKQSKVYFRRWIFVTLALATICFFTLANMELQSFDAWFDAYLPMAKKSGLLQR